MKNKFKLLATCLLAIGMVGAATACEQLQGIIPGFGTETPVNKYTVKFVDEDDTLIDETEYEEGAEIVVPADPTKAATDSYTYTFAGWDSEVSATATADVTYKATYTKTAIEYTVTFKADDVQVGEVLKYSADNKNISVPAVPEKPHYDGEWESYTLNTGNKVVNAVYTAKEYKVTFKLPNDVVYKEFTYTIETKDTITAPNLPSGAPLGYTYEWPAYDLTNGDNVEVKLQQKANTYEVTFDANGGTCEKTKMNVTFDKPYTLPTATPPTELHTFLGWVDNSGIYVEDGVWSITGNVTLKAVYQFNDITFENMTEVPSYFKKADNTESLNIIEKDGSKVLQLKNNGSAPAMKVTVGFLTAFFDNENVDYIAFDAKADTNNNNFRRDAQHSNGSLSAVTYERDYTEVNTAIGDGVKYPVTGVRADAWKTFYFSRADYNFWVSQGVTEARFIASGGFSTGQNIYIDNIRAATAEERAVSGYSFESVGIRVNDEGGKTLLFYMLDKGTAASFNMQVSSGGFKNAGLTSENVTDGRAAITFTKEAGTLNINLPRSTHAYSDIVTKTGYWAVDIYIPADSDATLSYQVTTYPGVTLKKGAWTTIYVCKSLEVVTLTDTTGGTYIIDNFRSITADEYNMAAYSMEANTGGLRDNTTVFYYYAGTDHTANKYSLAFTSNPTGVSFSDEKVHNGNYSLKITKESTGAQVNLQMRADSNFYAAMKNGFTFWIYSDKDIVASNLCNAYDKTFVGGYSVKANEWTKITVTAEDMKALSGEATQALRIKGDWTTLYIDGFQPLSAADAE